MSFLRVLKHDSADLRFMHDLSSPKGCSVNDGIVEDWYLNEPFKLHLPGINHLVAFIKQLGHGCHICKKDKLRIPKNPCEFNGLSQARFSSWRTILFPHRFPFWSLFSYFSMPTHYTKHSLHSKYHRSLSGHVCWWFLWCSYTKSFFEHFSDYEHLISEVGFYRLQPPRMFLPASAECLLVEIDTATMTLTVPKFCMDQLNAALGDWLDCSTYMKHVLQSLISACVWPSCVNMCHFLNALQAMPSLVSTVLLTVDITIEYLSSPSTSP